MLRCRADHHRVHGARPSASRPLRARRSRLARRSSRCSRPATARARPAGRARRSKGAARILRPNRRVGQQHASRRLHALVVPLGDVGQRLRRRQPVERPVSSSTSRASHFAFAGRRFEKKGAQLFDGHPPRQHASPRGVAQRRLGSGASKGCGRVVRARRARRAAPPARCRAGRGRGRPRWSRRRLSRRRRAPPRTLRSPSLPIASSRPGARAAFVLLRAAGRARDRSARAPESAIAVGAMRAVRQCSGAASGRRREARWRLDNGRDPDRRAVRKEATVLGLTAG